MRFIRDIINEKTKAAGKGEQSELRYPLRLREQDRTDDTPDEQGLPPAADDLMQTDQISRRGSIATNENEIDALEAVKDTHDDRVDYSAIASVLGTHQTAQPADSAQQDRETEEKSRVSHEDYSAILTGAAAPIAAAPTDQWCVDDHDAQASAKSSQTDWPASDRLRSELPETTAFEAPGTNQKGVFPVEDTHQIDEERPEHLANPEEVTQVAEPRVYVRSDKKPHTLESDAAPVVTEPKQQVTEAVQPAASTPQMTSLPSSVSAHKPAKGRGSKGRVKTRLLGFSAPQHPVHDPMSQSPEAAPAAQAQFPVGWLVVVDGPGKGASYSLFEGLTQIGRGESQTVRLDFGDNTISRENHAAIAFDGEQRRFFFGHGGKANLVRLNGRPVLSTEDLATNSVIRIGETTLRFVALCGDSFSWGGAEMEDRGHAKLG